MWRRRSPTQLLILLERSLTRVLEDYPEALSHSCKFHRAVLPNSIYIYQLLYLTLSHSLSYTPLGL